MQTPDPSSDKPPARRNISWQLVGIVLALTVGCVAYRMITWGEFPQTSALFVGLPVLLAVVVALTPKAKSIQGIIFKTLTLFLLLSMILFNEGMICILMAAPIFYLVGALVGFIISRFRRNGENDSLRVLWVAPLFLLMSLEGTHEDLSFDRAETVTAERIVGMSTEGIERVLDRTLRFDAPLPAFLTMGFPRPASSSGGGTHVGDRHVVTFSGDSAWVLVMEVVESRPGLIRFRTISDGTPIAGWMRWKESIVEYSAVDATHSRVRWTLTYDRLLDPMLYFRLLERYGAENAAEYLISTLGPVTE